MATTSANRLKPLNLVDFTGGVNLRPETFQLQPNEMPELLNLEVDPRGGLNTRKGWQATGPSVVQPGADGYVTPPVGTVSTPTPAAAPQQFTIITKLRGPTGTLGNIVGSWEGPGDCSWYLRRTTTGTIQMVVSTDGTALSGSYTVVGPAITGNDEWLAVTVDRTAARIVVYASPDDGRTWQRFDIRDFASIATPHVGTKLRVGGSGLGTDIFNGRIYDVEMRTGLTPGAGVLLWRFDANEYPTTGSPLSYADPRGLTWTLSAGGAITPRVAPGSWDPRNAYAHTNSVGSRTYFVVNNAATGGGQLFAKVDAGDYTPMFTASRNATPHCADFVSWGDDVYIVGGTAQTVRYSSTPPAGVELTRAGNANWQNDYTNPGTTDTFPAAELVATAHGYMFVASTTEDGVAHPTRLRWSHPNNPMRWASEDYIDISDGGQRITAIMSFSDRLLVFKPDSVWALFGYDADTWELANVSKAVGCRNQQVIARNESAVFFLSWPLGIFAYTDKGVTEMSVPIRSLFQNKLIHADAIDQSWFGWMGRRLWCSLPYLDEPPQPDDARTVFVLDPALSDPGSWTMFRGGDGAVPGPYMERTDADQEAPLIAFSRQYPYMIQLEAIPELAIDLCTPGVPTPFPTVFRTRWIDAGAPTWQKSWRRPDFLLRGLTYDTRVNVQVFHNFDAFNAQRSFMVQFTPDNYPAKWTLTGLPEDGGFQWGDGTLYGGSDQTSSIERGGTMGRAGVVQLRCVGDPGVVWGLNGIVFKFIPRRFR